MQNYFPCFLYVLLLTFFIIFTVQYMRFKCLCLSLIWLKVEQFWAFYSYLVRPGDLSGHSDIHLFKDGIKPMWEVKNSNPGNYGDLHADNIIFFI